MVNYELGKIYTIRSSETVGVYVGSTCQPLSVRFGRHKSNYKNNIGYTSSKHIFDYGIENAYIELLENYPCNNKEELFKREGEHIRMMENCVNHIKNVGIPVINNFIKCKCGMVINYGNKINHEKTIYHNNIVNPGMYKKELEKIKELKIKEKELERIEAEKIEAERIEAERIDKINKKQRITNFFKPIETKS